MTEKRFTTESVFIRDNQTQIVMECSCSEDADNIAEHLNALYKENIHLRELLDIGRTNAKSILDVLNDQEERLNAFRNENKRLNIFIERLHDIADENGAISRIRMKSEIHLFKEELE